MKDELRDRFTNHNLNPHKEDSSLEIREAALNLAKTIAEHVPEGREKSLALTKAEEATFWANAGVARG